MTGKQAKNELGLSGLKYVYVQKLLGVSMPIYLISYDSRYPKNFLSLIRVMQNPSTTLEKIKRLGASTLLRKNYRMTPPQRLESISNFEHSNSALYIFNDLAGNYHHDKKVLNESTNIIKYNIRYI